MKDINEVAEKMIKRGFESNDTNEVAFLDELSWIIDFEPDNTYLKDLKKEMEEIEEEKHSPKTLQDYLEKIGEI